MCPEKCKYWKQVINILQTNQLILLLWQAFEALEIVYMLAFEHYTKMR